MDTLKLSQAEFIIRQALKRCSKPCVFWSGGKDSMVLLHFLKFRLGLEMPVVCFREPWMPWKQRFVNRMIDEWVLEIWDWSPSAVQLCKGNGRIDVINAYQISPSNATQPEYALLARGTEPPDENLPFLCGVETFLARPAATFSFPWDGIFHGHKSSDVDPCSGEISLKLDVRQNAHTGVLTSFPLRHWTDDDIFDYTNEFNVPFDEQRYDPINRKVVQNDKFFNPDYYHTCFACVERGGPEFVKCPKYGVEMNNAHSQVPYVEPQASYCSLRDNT